MCYLKISIPAIIYLIVGCKSPSDKALDEFKKVNESLEKTNNKVDSLFRKVKFLGLDETIADSLKQLCDKSSSQIENLKNELNRVDKQGEKLDAAENILIKTSKGDSLFKYVMSVYDACIKYGDSSAKQEYILLRRFDKIQWLKKYFKDVPTVAAVTILSKFQNDFVQIRRDIMNAVKRN